MVKRDGAYTRSERIKDMRTFFLMHASAENPEPLPYRRTLAMHEVNYGLRRETVLEYWRIIEDLGEIELDESTDQIRVSKAEKT